MAYQELKQRQRQERDQYPENLSLRIHRSLSWLNRAEQETDDPDARFIFLWIAFNAAYATRIDERLTLNEQSTFAHFIDKLCQLDTQKRFNKLVWETFSGPIRVLLDNRYVFGPFWDYHRGQKSQEEWQTSFNKAKTAAKYAVAAQDTPKALSIVLSRIYTLRNQLLHGGATWAGSANRSQIRDCTAIMDTLVPLTIEIMMDNPNTLWGEPDFPVIKS